VPMRMPEVDQAPLGAGRDMANDKRHEKKRNEASDDEEDVVRSFLH